MKDRRSETKGDRKSTEKKNKKDNIFLDLVLYQRLLKSD